MQVRREHAHLRYLGRILAMAPTRLPRRVYEMLRAEGSRRSWTSTAERLAREWGLGAVWDTQRLPDSMAEDDMTSWRNTLRRIAKRRALAAHRDALMANPSSIARNYNAWHHVSTSDQQMRMAGYVRAASAEDRSVSTMFALRSGTSELRVDADRPFENDPANRVCLLCNLHETENAHHVLMRCPAHAQGRQLLINSLPVALRNLHDPRTFPALMGSDGLAAMCDGDEVQLRAAIGAINGFWAYAMHRRAQGPLVVEDEFDPHYETV